MIAKRFALNAIGHVFQVGVAISTDFPQVWYIDDENGRRNWFPFAVSFYGGEDGRIVSLTVIAFRIHFAWK